MITELSGVIGFLKISLIPLFTAFALLWLLMLAKKDKFYPAMPFVAVGCFVGYGVMLLVNLI